MILYPQDFLSRRWQARLLYSPDIWSSALDGTVAGIMADCDGVWYLVVAAAVLSLRTM
jgi:hypothetical protein